MTSDDRLLDLRAVRELTSLSRSELYRRVADGRFPAQIQVGPRRVAWIESEVRAWMRRVAEMRRPHR